MGLTITDTDHGYKALVDTLYGLANDKPTVTVGIHEGEGSRVHGDGSPATIIEIATWLEFGSRRTPARSFIGAWFDEAEPQLRKDFLAMMEQAVAGKFTSDQILEQLGQKMVGEIQQRMSAGIGPPLAASTVRQKKGSSTPLIDTGVLRSSIQYRVNTGGQ